MAHADPEALEAAARRLAAAATLVHRTAERLSATGRGVRWRGEAAEAFRRSLADDVARVRATADGLERASAELLRHAATVRERLARLRELT